MDIRSIAAIAYEANRNLSVAQGDASHAPWAMLYSPIRERYVGAVQWVIDNPEASGATQHDAWCRSRIADGWIYGAELNRDAKIHPLLRPYDELPPEARAKDMLWKTIVLALKDIPDGDLPAPGTVAKAMRDNLVELNGAEPKHQVPDPVEKPVRVRNDGVGGSDVQPAPVSDMVEPSGDAGASDSATAAQSSQDVAAG
jgi:hypothetical protein